MNLLRSSVSGLAAATSLAAASLAAAVRPARALEPLPSRAQNAGMPMHHDRKPAVPSTRLTVRFAGKSATFTPYDLAGLPQVQVAVHNMHTGKDEQYSGPLLSDVLAKAGFTFSEQTEHPMLRMYLRAEGTDGYWVLYSAAELQPALHKAQVIVATGMAGLPLAATGAFQLIDTMDVKPARWVRNLSGLTLVEPAEAK